VNKLVTEVLDRLVADIEAGKNPWKKSWKGGGGLPSNATTKRTYRGINTLMLWLAELDKGFVSSRWATFKQWGGAGRYVRKGEKGTPILFYKILERGEGDDKTSMPMLRVSWVFNEAQLDEDMTAEELPEHDPEDRHTRAAVWFDGLGVPLLPGAPSYSPLFDALRMPAPSSFTGLDEYWSTLFHETVHWTGHKSRLARIQTQMPDAYAQEELVAEIGAAFMGAHFGIDTEQNNAAYLRNWLTKVADKRQAIFAAAKDAGKAFEFLTTQPQQMEQAA